MPVSQLWSDKYFMYNISDESELDFYDRMIQRSQYEFTSYQEEMVVEILKSPNIEEFESIETNGEN